MEFTFLLDENMPHSVSESLNRAGHDTIGLNINTRGISDPEVLELARAQKRTVVTFDLGFANTLDYPPENFPGIVVLRRKSGNLTGEDVQILTNRLLEHLENINSLCGQLCIVERGRVRTYRS